MFIIRDWLELENFCNGARPSNINSLAAYTQFPEAYRPGAAPYEIQLHEVPKTSCVIFSSLNPRPDLLATYLAGDNVIFPVHLVNLENDEIPHLSEIVSFPFVTHTVRATASTRTVFDLETGFSPHCLKLHTNLKTTRWIRHMEMRSVQQPVAVTRIFEQAKVFREYPKVAFFPESLGVVYGGSDHEDWGFVVREMDSQPSTNRAKLMIPFCSLYLKDIRKDEEDPILVKLIRASKLEAKEYILEEVIFPLLTGWAKIYLETGILLEPHGQNVVVEVDPITHEIIRFVHRDFYCFVNETIVGANGFDISDMSSTNRFTTKGDEHAPHGCEMSIIFDYSFNVALEELAELAFKYFKVPKTELRQASREFMRREFPVLGHEHFPPVGSKYKYEDTPDGKKIITCSYSDGWR